MNAVKHIDIGIRNDFQILSVEFYKNYFFRSLKKNLVN